MARRFPRGTRITISCSGGGCPFKTFRRTVRRANENLHGPFGNACCAHGARRGPDHAREPDRAPAAFPLRTPGQPTVGFLCLPPGGGTRDC